MKATTFGGWHSCVVTSEYQIFCKVSYCSGCLLLLAKNMQLLEAKPQLATTTIGGNY